MEQSWTINGAYATWRMTVVIGAPEDGAGPNVPKWPSEKLAGVVGHFFEAVNHYETTRDIDSVRGLD
ncbi:hypothetical protein [Amycolatopsis sp. NPDC059027]|uniref:hypothetical protein n=1 Tax=unclassified Amycolatopsis TaxID=2618356 RepID=UPI00366FDC11